jgi:CDGSH-type Zn-finger protein
MSPFYLYSYRISQTSFRKGDFMGACQCGYTRDEEKNCDGTHKVVKAVKEDIAAKLAANEFPHASEYVKNN